MNERTSSQVAAGQGQTRRLSAFILPVLTAVFLTAIFLVTPWSTQAAPPPDAHRNLTPSIVDGGIFLGWNVPTPNLAAVDDSETLRRHPQRGDDTLSTLFAADNTYPQPGLAIRNSEPGVPSNPVDVRVDAIADGQEEQGPTFDLSLGANASFNITSTGRTTATAVYTVAAAGTYYLRHAPTGTIDWTDATSATAVSGDTSVTFSLAGLDPNARYDVQASSSSTYPGASTESDAFTNRPDSEDFQMETGNSNPRGISSDGSGIVWVVNEHNTRNRAYAYTLSSGAYDSSKSFDLFWTNDRPGAAHADAETLWVTDRWDDKVYAYNISSTGTFGAHQSDKDFNLASGNGSPKGMWGNDTTLWVSDDGSDRIFAYRKSDGSRDFSNDFTGPGIPDDVSGIWSDGTIMFAVNNVEDHVFAYDLRAKQRWTPPELDLDPANGDATGVWGNTTTLWVINDGPDGTQAIAYYTPQPASDVSGITVNVTSHATAEATAYEAYSDGSSSAFNMRYRATTTTMWTALTAQTSTTGQSRFNLTGLLVDHTYIVQASRNAAFPTESTMESRFGVRPAHKDFELAKGNEDARGMWSDGTTIWIANDGYGENNRVYAYNLNTGTPDTDKNFNLNRGDNSESGGVHSDGSTMYVSNTRNDKIFAYTITEGVSFGDQDSDKGFSMDSDDSLVGLLMPRGMWSDNDTLWIAGNVHEKIHAYNIGSTGTYGARDTAKECDLFPEYSSPVGVWSDGSILWVADRAEDRILAYSASSTSCGDRQPLREVRLDPENTHPWGIWSDGATIWIADNGDDKLYAYFLPPAPPQDVTQVAFNHHDRHKTDVTVTIDNPASESKSVKITYHAPPSETETTATVTTSSTTATFNLTGLEKDEKYIARIQVDGGAAAQTGFRSLSEQDAIQKILRTKIIEPMEGDYPWVRETFNGMRLYGIPVKRLSNGVGSTVMSCSSWNYPCSIASLEVSWTHRNDRPVYIHELAHVRTLGKGFIDEPTEFTAAGWIYFSELARGGTNCDISELYADSFLYTVGLSYPSSYFPDCSKTGNAPSTAETSVLTDIFDGTYPTWFTDRYENDDLPYKTSDDEKYQRNYDLEMIHTDVRAISSSGRGSAILNFQTAFGGYCAQYRNSDTRNPWRAGGCVPWTTKATGDGDNGGNITITWDVPEYDGGSPITKYQVEWRLAGQEFDSTRSADITDLSTSQYELTGMTAGLAVRVSAHNHNGKGVVTLLEDTATPEVPANVTLTPGDQFITVQWDPPTNNPTRYRVQWKPEADTWDQSSEVILDNTDRQYEITGLTNGTAYTVRVIAENLFGADATSDELTGTPTAHPQVSVNFGQASYTVAETDDAGTPSAKENEATVKVTLSADPKREVVILLTATDQGGVSNADYSGVPENVTFQSGDTEQTFTFSATADTVDDDGEKVKLTFGALPAGVSEGTTKETVISITDDDNSLPIGAPTITGMPRVGEVLTADTSGIDDEDGLTSPGYTYQWVRNDGSNDADITGATNSTYTLTPEDAGMQIKVKVSFTDDESNTEGPLASVLTDAVNRPATGAPSIIGILQEDEEITADTVGIADADGLDTFSYQWIADGTDIPGATSSTYTLLSAQVGANISVRVSFTDTAGDNESLTSAATPDDVVAAGATRRLLWVGTMTPATLATDIVGFNALRGTLTPSSFTSGSNTYSLEGVQIDASSLSILMFGIPTATEQARWIIGTGTEFAVADASIAQIEGSVSITWLTTSISWTAGTPVVLSLVEPINTPATGVPTITGTARVYETLTTDTSSIQDEDGLTSPAWTYQWVRVDGMTETDIGTNSSTYTLAPEDAGKQIKVEVTFTDDESNTEGPLASELTDAVNTPATGVPTITGTPRVNEVLTADTSGISDGDGITTPNYVYQWVRVDGDDETDIGTDSSTYTLTDAAADQAIKVKVTFTDDASTEEGPLVSEATDPIAPPDVLVRNTTAASNGFNDHSSDQPQRAQAFTTGAVAAGYELTSIGLLFHNVASTTTAGSQLVVTLNSEDNGDPDEALCTLSDPATFTSSGVHTFKAPTSGANLCPTLTANTTYFAVLNRATVTSDQVALDTTASTAEHAGGVANWSIGDDRHFYTSTDSAWNTVSSEPHLIEVKGTTKTNTAPEFDDTPPVTRSVPENTASGENIGSTVSATDTESDTLVFALTGTDASSFTIDTSNGQLKTSASLDFETSNSFSVSITVHDGKDATGDADTTVDDTITVTITLTNVDEPGTVTLPSLFAAGTAATATVADPDGTVSSESWQWARGDTATGTFTAIGSATSATYTPPAADVGKYLRATVTYKDPESTTNDKTASATSSSTVGATNSAPEFSATTATRTLPENSGAGVNVTGGVITATDSDSGDTLTYTLTGTDAGSFTIDSDGQIQTKTGVTHRFNFEATKNSYSVTVNVTDSKDDAGAADTVIDDTIAVTIDLTNVNEAPEVTNTTNTVSVVENETTVIMLAAADIDTSTTLTWSVETTDDGGKFQISSAKLLSFKTAPSFEMPTDVGDTAMNNTYVVTVKVTDDGSPALSDTHKFTITVTDVNEAPTFTSPPATATFAENGTGTVVDFDAADVDASSTLTFSVEPPSDGGKFDIDSSTGELTFKTAPNFEMPTDVGDTAMNNTYVVTVKVEDDGSPKMDATHTVTITVTNVNEAPEITTTSMTHTAFNVDENTATSMVIKTYEASDADANTTLTWSLEGNDAGDFTITKNAQGQGELKFANVPDHESPADTSTNNVYDFTVKVQDNHAGNLTDRLSVAVTVDDVSETTAVIVAFEFGSYSVAEGNDVTVKVQLNTDPAREVIIPVTTTNQDGASNADYSGVPANVAFQTGDTEKSFTFTASQDTEDDDDESVKLGFGTLPNNVSAGTTSEATVSITDDDDPTVTVGFEQASYSVAENATVEIKVRLSANPERQVIVPLAKTNQDGASNADYSGVPTSVTFEAGDTEKSFTFTAVQDTVDDDDESVKITFGPLPSGVTAGAADETTVSITDDDAPTTSSPPSVSITAAVTEPITAPFRVTITFTNADTEGNEYGVTGFEADEIIAYYTRTGYDTYEFYISDFREESPGRVYSALVDKIIDGELWIEVEADSAQSTHDGQGNTPAYETWQVDAPDPASAPEGPDVWADTLTVGGRDTGIMGYFIGWSRATNRDERFGALPNAQFQYQNVDYEILELSYVSTWRNVRLSMCEPLNSANSSWELRLGDRALAFGGDNHKTREFGRTKDGAQQQCREYDWEQITLDWQYDASVSVRITR